MSVILILAVLALIFAVVAMAPPCKDYPLTNVAVLLVAIALILLGR
jgi:hypothetical protein